MNENKEIMICLPEETLYFTDEKDLFYVSQLKISVIMWLQVNKIEYQFVRGSSFEGLNLNNEEDKNLYYSNFIEFTNEEDAMAFKLRWL